MDGAEKAIELASKFTGLIPPPAGPIVDGVAKASLMVIKMIKVPFVL